MKRAFVLGKIAGDVSRAVALRARDGAAGGLASARLASGAGWSVDDVVCNCGPHDRPFEEEHTATSVTVVVAGSFAYSAGSADALMTPGSLMLGNARQRFTCGHTHAAGDRCVAFRFSGDLFDQVAADAGLPRDERRFRVPRIPPLRESSRIIARTCMGVLMPTGLSWEETALQLAHAALRLSAGLPRVAANLSSRAVALATEAARRIERDPANRWTLQELVGETGLSPFQYLRAFTRATGVTPHQFVLRARLRAAAIGLATADARVIGVAAAAGFDDLSNFNRAFKAEFGVPPLEYRRAPRLHT